jgi:uncharacterized repeat protein (TIGR03803 family)
LVLSGYTLYGVTAESTSAFGGGSGTVFKVNTDGQGFAVLHAFDSANYPTRTNNDGAAPKAGLVLAGHTLYGTTSEGGDAGSGIVFKINTDGAGFAVLHSFIALDGARPLARLARSGNTLFGTTQRGAENEGTVFKLDTEGSGFTTLHSFSRLTGRDLTNWDGAFPEAELVVSGDTLYGTAWSGGPGGGGTVFKLNTNGSGFAVLHGFIVRNGPFGYNDHGGAVNADGAYPEAGLVLSGTTLYGSAHTGGQPGAGTVFKLNIDGTGFTVLHIFAADRHSYPERRSADGGQPKGLALSGKALYGIASDNGRGGWGTLFRVNTDGKGFEVLHSFDGRDGSPAGGSLLVSGDTLYGTTTFGGGLGGGTLFRADTRGKAFAVLHRFTKHPPPPALTD